MGCLPRALFLPAALVIAACAYTERDVHDYQTGDLLLRADIVLDARPDATPVQQYSDAYHDAVRAGDVKAMREALRSLNAELPKWEAP